MADESKSQAILIVGGGQGIGKEVCTALLSQSPTVKLVLFSLFYDDPDSFHPIFQDGTRVWSVTGDVTKLEDRRRAIRECEERMGGIDTLVYTAGVITPIERIEKLNIEDVKKAFDVNVFGCMAMCQLVLPYIRKSRIAHPLNTGYGKILILSSACDSAVTYHGWTPYCTTKAALTRFIEMLAHEEPLISVQGVYPKLTRTKMPVDVIAGKYKGIMADHEIERFRVWNDIGDEMVEPAAWCGEAVGKLALGLYTGARSGETKYYDEHVPRKVVGT